MTEQTGFPEPGPELDLGLPPQPATSLTPVGDYLHRRYPPNNGATHWMGAADDPGCSAVHPLCIYGAAWREALREFAAEIEEMGAMGDIVALAREKADAAGSNL